MSPRVSAVFAAAASSLALAVSGAAWAQASNSPASPTAPAVTAAANADPVLAKVDDQEIRVSDLRAALGSLPPNIRQLPPQTLYPMLLDRLIDQEALAREAKATGYANQPQVRRQVELAKTLALGSAMLTHEVGPAVTEAAVKAAYDQQYANKPPPEEVHAEDILVSSEAQAKAIIAQLKKGASWDALAKKYSLDKGAGDAGDLGWFTKDQMVPAFADEAFKLKPHQVSPEPVHTQFGWHVIKVLGRRAGKQPTFEEAQGQIRQQLAQKAAEKAVTQALARVKVVRYTPAGVPAAEPEAAGAGAPPAAAPTGK